MLAPSAFLTSAASTLAFQQDILPPSYSLVGDDIRIQVESVYVYKVCVSTLETIVQHYQDACDAAIVNSILRTFIASAVTDVNTPDSKHHLLLTLVIGFTYLQLLSWGADDEVGISVAPRLVIKACSLNNGVCGRLVDVGGLRGLLLRSTPRHHVKRHYSEIHQRAHILSHKEPTEPYLNEISDRTQSPRYPGQEEIH